MGIFSSDANSAGSSPVCISGKRGTCVFDNPSDLISVLFFISESPSVSSVKYFRRSQFHPVAKQKKFEILKNCVERESYFLPSSISIHVLCIQIPIWKGDFSTTALNLVIFRQAALFEAIHIYSFSVIPHFPV